MEPIPLTFDGYGRRRTTSFIAILHNDVNEDEAQQQATGIYERARQILCKGLLPLSDEGTLLPLNIAVPEDVDYATVLFCLKKYSSDVRLTIYANDLNFQTGGAQGDVQNL